MVREINTRLRNSMGIYDPGIERSYGLLAEFSDPGSLLHAAKSVREAGYRHYDTHSPFPIHGMDRAMGLGQSALGYFVFGGALAGLALGLWLQWWTGGVDYPINIGGKPFYAWQASTPVTFELTILLAAFTAVIGMFAMNGLPRPYNPLFYSEQFARVTDDAFFLHIAASDVRFDRDATERFLLDIGALSVEEITDHEVVDPIGPSPEPDPESA
jgi:hypothetical protein